MIGGFVLFAPQLVVTFTSLDNILNHSTGTLPNINMELKKHEGMFLFDFQVPAVRFHGSKLFSNKWLVRTKPNQFLIGKMAIHLLTAQHNQHQPNN